MRRAKGNPHYFLAQFLPLAVLVLVAAGFLYHNRIDAEMRRLQLEQRERVSLGAASLTNDLDAPLRHLSILTSEAPIAHAINQPTPENLAQMAENFSTLMLRNPYYDQVRWIDQDGMEKVRVNMTSMGPAPAFIASLQNKRDRPYFSDTMALPRGEMLVSPMDLNVENGKIEVPHKPTVRLAVAVASADGKPGGIIIINVLMAPLLDRFSNQVERGTNRAMLLNGDGYWLYSTSSADEWAFMFKREETLAKRHPKVWKAMAAQAAGTITEDGIWSWQRVDLDASTGRYGLHQQSPWTVVLYLPEKRMQVDNYNILLRLCMFVGLILLALALLSWQLASNRRRREAAVHERFKAEAELSASEKRVADLLQHQETRSILASIVASSEDAIIGTGLDDVINSWNPAAEKLFGYLSREVLNQSAYILVPPERTGEARRITDQLMEGKTVSNFETVRWHKDGRLLDISVTVSPILDGDKKIAGISYIARDITNHKRLEKELSQYRQHLEGLVEQQTRTLRDTNSNLELALTKSESATRAKSSFLSNMSHEIRTPMNAVLGLTYLLEKTVLQSDQRDLVRKIIAAGHSLLGIINDILDVSKIEAGRLEVEHVPFRLSAVLENVVNVTAPAIGDKDVELVVGFNDVGVEHLYGDALRLEQILTNLTSNAIKFTARGEISIHVAVISEIGDKVMLRFAVTDSGIGIPPERQQDIFQAFTQEDTSTTRRYGGTGLGLTICRHLVQLMNGEIGVTSEPGKGSQFWFMLPFQAMPPAAVQLPADGPLCVLVADDNATARAMLSDTIKSMGWQVDVVESGQDAVSKTMTRLRHNLYYDIYLLDWKMPGMDGLAAAKAIREASSPQARPPIVIMVTAHARDEVLNAPDAELVDAVITKPVTPSTLYNTIIHVRQHRDETRLRGDGSGNGEAAPQASGGRDNREDRITGVRVLVVDDSEINREVAKRILEADGAEVFAAADGQEAVDWLRERPQGVDLVLMDIQMPVMDGYTATHEIRDTLQLRELPVIALTAGAFKAQQEAAMAAGMNGFLSKPYNVEQIISVVRQHIAHLSATELERRRTAPAAYPSATVSTVFPSATVGVETGGSAAVSAQDLSGIDVAVGLEAWGSEDIYRKFLGKFAEQYGKTGSEILAHIQADELPQAKTLAHKLRGSAGTLAVIDVHRLAGELEGLLSGAASASDCTVKAAELDAALTIARRAIDSYTGTA
ncbi:MULTISPECIES: response regulator [unclassified Herbaspirillum]|uniref:response regulator n=1 Tax=unclassified Herbaspirillum TaxID=2624150 RepID=UPI000E2FA579|nr:MULTISPECIES: response regulator [unclassified Herbaspirillum]RFB67449.1 response regulator [Herbaspirillum sp. 3R-3a1]TFI05055.1 response regulator [Herbaspirillum sp. 3R11]TFI12615.1 response regulator [Herbaspirillum sp. 3R-11]TFI28387.1 response regulator [Herbaspirillum sp. 3C11]